MLPESTLLYFLSLLNLWKKGKSSLMSAKDHCHASHPLWPFSRVQRENNHQGKDNASTFRSIMLRQFLSSSVEVASFQNNCVTEINQSLYRSIMSASPSAQPASQYKKRKKKSQNNDVTNTFSEEHFSTWTH